VYGCAPLRTSAPNQPAAGTAARQFAGTAARRHGGTPARRHAGTADISDISADADAAMPVMRRKPQLLADTFMKTSFTAKTLCTYTMNFLLQSLVAVGRRGGV
jgi:hypothetical protein